jgi:hypothetical protein
LVLTHPAAHLFAGFNIVSEIDAGAKAGEARFGCLCPKHVSFGWKQVWVVDSTEAFDAQVGKLGVGYSVGIVVSA